MALPIRPTPVLTGVDAERLEAYMAESETHKEKIGPLKLDWEKINAAYARMLARDKERKAMAGV